jgi:hypothetical protein
MAMRNRSISTFAFIPAMNRGSFHQIPKLVRRFFQLQSGVEPTNLLRNLARKFGLPTGDRMVCREILQRPKPLDASDILVDQ